jgi:hypothetical protein
MYIGGVICMWFLRTWKIREIEKMDMKSEQEIRDNDVLPQERAEISRHTSRTSVKSKMGAARGLWSWQQV